MTTPSGRSAGERIGAYELVRALGSGAMGDVWEAILHGPAGFRKAVALKLLRGGPKDDEARTSLVQEARLGALLQHPNVVGTLGLGESAGTWHVALELVRGASVAELIRERGRLPGCAVLAIGIQVAAGLAHVHELEVGGRPAGLVHRDVKPANLLVDRTGLVKLVDLGISVLQGTAGSAAGTPGYMAPEQAAGRPEAASDLFSLGAVLYVLATGRRPFGTSLGAVKADWIDATSREEGFLARVDAAVPGLGDVVGSCLRTDPRDRPGSAREVGEALSLLRVKAPAGPSLLQLLAEVRPGLVAGRQADPPSDLPTHIVPTGNVRAPRDRFLGRREELAVVEARVRAGERLVVLLGLGGMGKTRLGLEVARRLRHELPGGAWAFDLTEARSEEGLCVALAAALSIQLDRRDPVGQLGRVIGTMGRALVMMDNLEQCVEHLPRTLGRWLDLAPEATFIATTRLSLGLVGEHTVALGPLATPDAVALFLERASRPVTAEERPEVEPLCVALEGMPLAIELAAARVKLLGVARIRGRLSLGLLSGGRRELPVRHRSLEASLDWSADLLTGEGRAALGQLAVFDGGFTLEAAEAILDGVGDALGVLQELTDASLLRVDAEGARFSLLVVVREYATAKQSTAARDAVGLRHGVYFAQLGAPEAVAALEGPGGLERRRLLGFELDNLVAACTLAITRGDGRVAVAALRGAWAVMFRQGPFPFAADLAARVSGMPGVGPRAEAEAAAIAARAFRFAARPAEASTQTERAIAIYRELADRRAEGLLLGQMGLLQSQLGRPDQALAHHEQALATAREFGDRRAEAVTLCNLGMLHWEQSQSDLGRTLCEEALFAARESGDRSLEGVVLGNLAIHYHRTGRNDIAQAHYLHALAIHREQGDRRSEANVLGNLAGLYQEQGQADLAHAHYDHALALLREVGHRVAEGLVVGSLGSLHMREGRFDLAEEHLAQALEIHRESGSRGFEASALSGLGHLFQQQGRLDVARSHYDAALAIGPAAGGQVEGFVRCQLARIAGADGRIAEATALLDRGEAALREVGDPAELARLLACRAEVAHRAGLGEVVVRSILDEATDLAGGRDDIRREVDRARAFAATPAR